MFKNKKEKLIIGYSLLSYLLAFIGAVILSPVGGWVYSNLFTVSCNTGLFFLPWSDKCQLVGFIFIYPLLLSLTLILLLKYKSIINLIFSWLIGNFFIILLFLDNMLYLLNLVIFGFIGYLIGKLIIKIESK